MNRNLKALHGESDDNNNDKENGIDDGVVDDFKELAQELNEKKWLGEPVEQTLAHILETVWPNLQSLEKWKIKCEHLRQTRKL